jgi:hypothetical protein
MDYSLAKWLIPSFCSPQQQQLTPYPSIDYVNPGIGQIVQNFSFYQPLYLQSNAHAIGKKIDPGLMLEGKGSETDAET